MKTPLYILLGQLTPLIEQAGESVFVSLLLIRHLAQEGFFQLESGEKSRHLREIFPDQGERDYIETDIETDIETIEHILAGADSRFPFFSQLIRRNRQQAVSQEALRELIWVLSASDMEDVPSLWLYEAYMSRKVPEGPASPGDFYTPGGVVQCLAALVELRQGTAYDPCCGSGALLYAMQKRGKEKLQLFGQTQDEGAYLQAQIYLTLSGIHMDLGKGPTNTLAEDEQAGRRFDYIIANPPFNLKDWAHGSIVYDENRWPYGIPPQSNANFAWLQHILTHMAPGARAAVILPNGTLTTRVRKEAVIREAILREGQVEAIISLPPGLFHTTGIPCCVWLLRESGGERDEVLFVDAGRMKPTVRGSFDSVKSGRLAELVSRYRQGRVQERTEWYGTASLEEIREQGGILSPNLYIAVSRPRPSQLLKGRKELENLIDALAALPMDSAVRQSVLCWKNAEAARIWERAELPEIYEVFGGVMKRRGAFGKGFPMLDVKTVLRTPYVPERFKARADVTEEEKHKYDIRRGDVFLNRTSETGEELACCSVAVQDREAVYCGFIKRLRPRAEVLDPLYASCYFSSEIYRWEVERVSTVYTTYASMDNQKLSKIPVYFPDGEMQERIGDTLYRVFQYGQQQGDGPLNRLLEEFRRLLIQQYITYPVLCIWNEEEDYICRPMQR
ncbi:MAG: N-6 DNA methylase [Lachnospiraceae bacterium]|nr:N-6 DNA methylase [Lachnospiraceae bacterium]